VMQTVLACAGVAAGVSSFVVGGTSTWLVGAALLLLVVPFTLLVLMPTNRALLAPDRDRSSSETRALLERWGRLHHVRTVLGAAAALVFVSLQAGG